MDKEVKREQLKKEFTEYLKNCVSSQITKEPLEPTSIKSIQLVEEHMMTIWTKCSWMIKKLREHMTNYSISAS